PEVMALVKGKKTEEVIPYAEAQQKKLPILKERRGKDARDKTLPRGAVYLENDRRERKATGSYYTPDYIVKYIVEHTVGPVLDRAFEQLTPRLRVAQKGYRDAAKLEQARRKAGGAAQSPATYWNNLDMEQLVDDCLTIPCLDPAMGGGNFLVEVVDYVSNRLISFLNGWSENPVWAFIE